MVPGEAQVKLVCGTFALVVWAAAAMSAQVSRDSAGIHIIENARPTWTGAQALHLAPTPSLVIGDRAGEPYLLSRVAGAARLSDGRIVIGDGASLQIRFYDAKGTFIKAVGRKGEGPGEYRELRTLRVLSGDTIIVESAQSKTTSAFSGTGAFLWQWSPNQPPVHLPPGMVFPMAPLGGGVTAVASYAPVRTSTTRRTDSMFVAIVDRNSKTMAELGQLPVQVSAPQNGMPFTLTFGATGVYSSTATRFFYGFGAEFSVGMYTADGKLDRIIRRKWGAVPVTRADIDAYQAEWAKRWIKSTGAAARADTESLRNEVFAKTLPAFSQFIADRTGRLWVRDVQTIDVAVNGSFGSYPLVASTWNVFDSKGIWLGDVTMPARFSPKEIGADYVLGVARDADGVETVVMYGLQAGR